MCKERPCSGGMKAFVVTEFTMYHLGLLRTMIDKMHFAFNIKISLFVVTLLSSLNSRRTDSIDYITLA